MKHSILLDTSFLRLHFFFCNIHFFSHVMARNWTTTQFNICFLASLLSPSLRWNQKGAGVEGALLLTFTGAVGGRVYFRSSGVYVNEREKKRRNCSRARLIALIGRLDWCEALPHPSEQSTARQSRPNGFLIFLGKILGHWTLREVFLACKYWKTSWRFLNCGPFKAGHPFIKASWWGFAGWYKKKHIILPCNVATMHANPEPLRRVVSPESLKLLSGNLVEWSMNTNGSTKRL